MRRGGEAPKQDLLQQQQPTSLDTIEHSSMHQPLCLHSNSTLRLLLLLLSPDGYDIHQSRFAPASIIATLGYFSSAYLLRSVDAFTSRLLYAAGGAAAFAVPFTVLVMFPTNKRIVAKGKRSERGDPDVNSGVTAQETQRDLDLWKLLNGIRISSSAIAYGLALYAILPKSIIPQS